MNFRKLNEKLDLILNEISDETKASYLAKRRAQVKDAENRYYFAQADLETQKQKLNKADKMLNKSDLKQISKYPDKTDLDTAREMLNTLKSKMKKVDDPIDWEIEEIQDGNYHALNLYVRGWGEWVEREEDDDQAPLSDKYKSILQKILIEVQKQYGIKIINQGSEKKGLSFDVIIENSLENPKFGEWFDRLFYNDCYALSVYSSQKDFIVSIDMYMSKDESFFVRVIIEEDDLPFEIDVADDFNHVPSIEEIKKLVLKYYPEYTKIKKWDIPNIPNRLVSKWNALIKDETFINNVPHKFKKWKEKTDWKFPYIYTTADTLLNEFFGSEIFLYISKEGDKYEAFLRCMYYDDGESQIFDSFPTKRELIDFCKKGSHGKKYNDVDYDSIPEIPKRMKTMIQES